MKKGGEPFGRVEMCEEETSNDFLSTNWLHWPFLVHEFKQDTDVRVEISAEHDLTGLSVAINHL